MQRRKRNCAQRYQALPVPATLHGDSLDSALYFDSEIADLMNIPTAAGLEMLFRIHSFGLVIPRSAIAFASNPERDLAASFARRPFPDASNRHLKIEPAAKVPTNRQDCPMAGMPAARER
jgi:hypothetical protein